MVRDTRDGDDGRGSCADRRPSRCWQAAFAARTGSELAALTADLPAEPGRQAKELVRIDQRFGEITRTGRWVVPKRMEIKATAGDVDDLTVRMGDVSIRPAAGSTPVALTVVVSGRVRVGNVVARFPRRTFGQWMRRQPPRWKLPGG